MPLVVNGTTVKTLAVNSTTCKTGICNNVTVFTSEVQLYPGATIIRGLVTAGTYGSFYSKVSGVANGNSTMMFFQVDVTNYKTITATGTFKSDNSHDHASAGIGLYTAYNTAYWNQYFYYTRGMEFGDGHPITRYKTCGLNSSATSLSIDVSALSGNYYFGIGAYSNGGTSEATVTSVIAIPT